MAIAFDAFSRPGTGTGVAGDQSWTHTPVGTPRAALVWVLYGVNTVATVDHVVGVTYGGVAMTEVSGSPILKSTTETMQAHLFVLYASIPTGAQTVSVDTDGNVASYSAGCITLTASQDGATVDVDATINSDSVTDPSVTLSLGGVSCLAAIGFTSGQNATTGITPLTGWTAQSEEDVGGQTMGMYTYDTIGTADVTAGWTQTAEDAVAIAIAVREAAGGGAATPHGPFGLMFHGPLGRVFG